MKVRECFGGETKTERVGEWGTNPQCGRVRIPTRGIEGAVFHCRMEFSNEEEFIKVNCNLNETSVFTVQQDERR